MPSLLLRIRVRTDVGTDCIRYKLATLTHKILSSSTSAALKFFWTCVALKLVDDDDDDDDVDHVRSTVD